MNALTMNEAKAMGLTRYFTGKSCPHGHVAERFVSTRACSECAKGRKKDWRQAYPEKENLQKRLYVKANAEKVNAWKSAEQKRNRESANLRNRRYYEAHREFIAAKTAAWAQKNKARNNAKSNRRRATKLRATPAWADHEAIGMIYRAAEIARISGFDVHVDHAVPLQGRRVTGFHVHTNLQLLDASRNRQKSNHL